MTLYELQAEAKKHGCVLCDAKPVAWRAWNEHLEKYVLRDAQEPSYPAWEPLYAATKEADHAD